MQRASCWLMKGLLINMMLCSGNIAFANASRVPTSAVIGKELSPMTRNLELASVYNKEANVAQIMVAKKFATDYPPPPPPPPPLPPPPPTTISTTLLRHAQ